MSTKNELIELLLPGVLQTGQSEAEARQLLERSTVSELGMVRDRQIRAGIYRPTQPQPVPAPTVTKEDVEREKLRHQEELSEIRLRGVAERCADNELFKLQKQEWERPQREAQLRRDREVFVDAAKTLRNFATNEANFSLLRSAVGELSVSAIQRAIQGGLQLVGPTEEQLAEYQRDDVEQHNQRLLSASPTDLRAIVRSESESRRAQSALEAQAEADRAHQTRDAARKYPSLPFSIRSTSNQTER